MKPIFLRNHNVHKHILKYFPDSGQFEQVARSELEVQEARGFYVNVGSDFVGVYASHQGPTCFYNDRRFLLSDEACEVKLTTGKDKNHFALFWNGVEQFSVHYPQVKMTNFGAWTDEEMLDFFLWLAHSVSQEHFYTYYTLE